MYLDLVAFTLKTSRGDMTFLFCEQVRYRVEQEKTNVIYPSRHVLFIIFITKFQTIKIFSESCSSLAASQKSCRDWIIVFIFVM